MESVIKEKFINKSIEPISLESTEKMINQMKKCVCKINIRGTNGTGFFLKVPCANELIKVLITNNHLISQADIDNEISFIIKLNNDKEQKVIKINKKRNNFTDKKLDVTFIEITEKEDINDFLELDNEIINNLSLSKEQIDIFNQNYINNGIYILNYLKGEKIMASFGLIINIKENEIYHSCNTDQGSSGSPILSVKNNKLIGVHYGSSKNFDFNFGCLMIYAINEFNKNISKKNDSRIKIKNEIQFIQNFPFTDINIHIDLPKDDNVFEWKGFFIGPDDTPYKGGIFNFKIIFPDNFPEYRPHLIFLNPIYHINVRYYDSPLEHLGYLACSLFTYWIPNKMSIREVLTKLYLMFYLNNSDSPYGLERAIELRNNPNLFFRKVKYFTEKYANPISASQIYDHDWDFTYKENIENDYINIIIELNGVNRFNFQVNKKEIAKNVIYNYCNSIGVNINSVFCYHNKTRVNLEKTIEENKIENNSLIVLIDSYDVLFG